jgi:hypothetical protein
MASKAHVASIVMVRDGFLTHAWETRESAPESRAADNGRPHVESPVSQHQRNVARGVAVRK